MAEYSQSCYPMLHRLNLSLSLIKVKENLSDKIKEKWK